MKISSICIFAILMVACTERQDEHAEADIRRIDVVEFQSILDSADLLGAILILDSRENRYYSNDFRWCESGQLPASTFKIPNSIIALESGVMKDLDYLFPWNGEKRAVKNWEQDLNFTEAFHFSCVPCYREVARKIGVETMQAFVEKFDYGKMVLDSSSIDNFWLVGESKINQFQQINFLRRFFESELPIKPRTEKMMKVLMVIQDRKALKISGKTGWSVQGRENNGWFVGYVETKDNVYYFATNVSPNSSFDMNAFPEIRRTVTWEAFKILDITT